MKKTIVSTLAGLTLLGGATVPVVPDDMTLLYSYQTTDAPADPNFPANPLPFKDKDGNGVMNVAVFQDSKGKIVAEEIPDATYKDMGKSNETGKGSLSNPKKKEFRSVADIVLAPEKVEAAIAFDAFTAGTLVNPGTSVTISHTTSGSDRILFGGGIVRTNTITGMTYNGTGMTAIGSPVTGVNDKIYLFYMVAPATGAHNLVISQSGSSVINGNAISYTGASQTGQPDAYTDTAQQTVANQDGTVTTIADNSWAVMYAYDAQTGDSSAGAGTTKRGTSNGGANTQFYDGNGAKTPAGSYTLNFVASDSPGTNVGMCNKIASFAPVYVAPPAITSDIIMFE
jgi:hypothetical protein